MRDLSSVPFSVLDLALTEADELMLTSQIFDHVARLRSFEPAARTRERAAGNAT